MSDGEDDWFERALREQDGDAADTADDAAGADGAADDTDSVDDTDDTADTDDVPASENAAEESVTDHESGTDSDDLFGDDFAAALENADAPGGADGPVGPGAPAAPDASTGGDFDPNAGFGGEPFADPFDSEEFDSDIPRIDVGIEGLDSMILGGVPERSLIVAIGNAGTGKTTFGLQFLYEALQNGENAVYITLEESHDRIVDTATEKGWAFDEFIDDDQLAVIDLDPVEMANTLRSIRSELPDLVDEFGATRLVLDSVSLLEMMYDDQATRRNEIFDFTKSLKEAGVTTMLTSEANEDNAYASRFGIIEYLTDAVFVLRYIRGSDDFVETRLAIEIQKIRDANHSREIKPYEITNSGISVYGQANIF